MAEAKEFEVLLAKHHSSIREGIDAYNKAFKEGKMAEMATAEADLKEAEGLYAQTKQNEVFTELAKAEKPVKAAITQYSFLIVGHKMRRDEDGNPEGFEIIEDKVRQIDLVKFCKHCKLSTDWQYMVEKLNMLLAVRAATELKMTKRQIEKLSESFYMSKLARDLDMGATPTSNTQIVKKLQRIMDALVFEPGNGEGNVYKVNSHDVAYLLMCYTRRGKKVLSVAVAKNGYMHRLVADVAHRVVCGKVYDLEYRMKAVETEEKAADAEKKAEPKNEVEEEE